MLRATGNDLWDAFVDEVPWVIGDKDQLQVSPPMPPGTWVPASADFSARFPVLSGLLRKAQVTEVEINQEHFRLFTWQSADSQPAWLSPAVPVDVPQQLTPEHRLLLSSFGGVTERAGEQSGSWLLNLNQALTVRASQWDAAMLNDYAWAFEPGRIPIEVHDYYAIAVEANGNTTFAHRETGQVLLFAPDHDFQHIQPLDGCPEHTLYTIQNASTFRDWVEVVAAQQLELLQ